MNAIGRFSMVLAVAVASLPEAARGQHDAPSRVPAVSAGAPTPLIGVGPGRSGRVAGAVFRPQAVPVTAAATTPAIPELSVTAAVAGAVTPEPAGRVNLRLLDRDITAKFASLGHCRTDVARRKRVPPGPDRGRHPDAALDNRRQGAGRGDGCRRQHARRCRRARLRQAGHERLAVHASRRRRRAAQSRAGFPALVPAGSPSLSAALRARRLDRFDLGARGGREPGKMSWRAASQMATTAGCLILRSTEMA